MDRDSPSRDSEDERPRDHAGKWIKTLEGAERDAEAARLWGRGMTFQRIALELGYSDRHNARRGVLDALKAAQTEGVPEVRKAQLGLIAELKQAAVGILEEDHYVVSYGQIMKDGNGEPLIDPAVKLAAIDRLDRLIARESLLTGTPMPVRAKLELGDGDRESELLAVIEGLRSTRRPDSGSDGEPAGS